MEHSCMGLFLITAVLIEHVPALEMHTEEEATTLTIRWVFPRPAADSRLILMHLSVVMGCVCWLETLLQASEDEFCQQFRSFVLYLRKQTLIIFDSWHFISKWMLLLSNTERDKTTLNSFKLIKETVVRKCKQSNLK